MKGKGRKDWGKNLCNLSFGISDCLSLIFLSFFAYFQWGFFFLVCRLFKRDLKFECGRDRERTVIQRSYSDPTASIGHGSNFSKCRIVLRSINEALLSRQLPTLDHTT